MTRNRLLKTLGAMFMTTTLLTGCHDSSTIDEPRADILSRFSEDGTAWLTLEIDLANQQKTTRADEVTYVDGDPAEYLIKAMKLVLFHGKSTDPESALKVCSTYDVDYSPTMDVNTQITSRSKTTIQISFDNINSGDALYMLAVANLNGSPAISAGETFQQVREKTTASITSTIGGTTCYIMSNSPLADANDGTGTVTTLRWIDPNYIYPTSDPTWANPATAVYLERAAAKVTVEPDASLPLNITGNANIQFAASDLTYAVDNYNTEGYLVRHFDEDWLPYQAGATDHRFTESAALATSLFRTHWATDINPSGNSGLTNYTTTGAPAWKGLDEADYCAENTFTVAAMTNRNTTSALVRLQLNDGTGFYTTSVTGSDILYQYEKNPPVTEEGSSAKDSFAPRRSNKVGDTGIDEYLRQWLVQNSKATRDWVNQYAAGNADYLKIHVAQTGEGAVSVTAVTQTAQADPSAGATAFATLETSSGLAAFLNAHIKVYHYPSGYCYYRIPIKHFGDELTPWTSAKTMTDNTTATVYGTGTGTDAKYLGRYGVVRNNWYNLTVRSITHVGHYTIPPLTDDADDTVEQLLNAQLSITPWTTHTN